MAAADHAYRVYSVAHRPVGGTDVDECLCHAGRHYPHQSASLPQGSTVTAPNTGGILRACSCSTCCVSRSCRASAASMGTCVDGPATGAAVDPGEMAIFSSYETQCTACTVDGMGEW